MIASVFRKAIVEVRVAAYRAATRLSFLRPRLKRRIGKRIQTLERGGGGLSWELLKMYELFARCFEADGDYDRAMMITEKSAGHPLLRELAVEIYVQAGVRYVERKQFDRARRLIDLAERALAERSEPDADRAFIDFLRQQLDVTSS